MYNYDIVNFMLLYMYLVVLVVLRYIILNMLKTFVRKVDLISKHDEGTYMNDDDQDESRKKGRSHEIFFDAMEKKLISLS